MSWETLWVIVCSAITGLSVAAIYFSRFENRFLKEENGRWKQERDEVYEIAKNYGETVREGFSKEVSLALDTLIAANALTEREKSIILAIAYHADPLEKDGRLLSGRILSQLAFEDAIAR